MRIELKRGNDQTVTLPHLRIVQTGQFLNAATVIGVLVDSRGEVLDGFDQIPLTYIPGSDGNYLWDIDGPTLMMPVAIYSLIITAAETGLDFRVVYEAAVVD